MAAILMLTAMLTSCSHSVEDRRLKEIAAIVSDSAEVALQRLDSITPESLSVADRHYLDLLTTKARDKAYIPHGSDSLIMTVIDYAESHRSLDWYPEALYYAGRVYADLGDFPMALRYFHSAFDELSENGTDLELKSAILSQTARLLHKIGLIREALNKIEQVIDLNITSYDTLSLVYDLQLAGDICIRMDSIHRSEKYIKKALEIGENLPTHIQAKSRMYLAAAKYRSNDMDSALILIRDAVGSVKNKAKHTATAYAARIYHAYGIADTAFMYAGMLVSPEVDHINRHIGYQILLDKDMLHLSPSDSIDSYISTYGRELNRHFRDRTSQLEMVQQASYNYSLHEKKRIEAENSQKNIMLILFASGMALFALTAVVFYLKYRNRDLQMKLRKAIDKIGRLSEDLNAGIEEKSAREDHIDSELSISEMRKELQNRLISLTESIGPSTKNNLTIVDQKIYELLQNKIKAGQLLTDCDALWTEIECAVEKNSPDFKKRLNLLCVKKIKHDLWQTALLIKIGMSPTEVSKLLGRTKSTITMRRITLGQLCFDKKFDSYIIDSIIRSL